MHTQTWLDRTRWPSGPWDDEPDRADWIDEKVGLPCLAIRQPIGAWCGYVAVPPRHPWHGLGYDDIDVRVHGGLTYAGPSYEDSSPQRIGLLGESDDAWWIGFDCGHLGDRAPLLDFPFNAGEYRTLAYVKLECTILAAEVWLAGPNGQVRAPF